MSGRERSWPYAQQASTRAVEAPWLPAHPRVLTSAPRSISKRKISADPKEAWIGYTSPRSPRTGVLTRAGAAPQQRLEAVYIAVPHCTQECLIERLLHESFLRFFL